MCEIKKNFKNAIFLTNLYNFALNILIILKLSLLIFIINGTLIKKHEYFIFETLKINVSFSIDY